MTSRRILFIGGSGVISASSVRLAVAQGHRVTVMNRGRSSSRDLPDEVETLVADANDWPKLLYGRLGFDEVGHYTKFFVPPAK